MEPDAQVRVVADTDQVDVGFAVDLATAEKEDVDTAAPGCIENLTAAVGMAVEALGAENGDAQVPAATLARKHGSSGRDGRDCAGNHVTVIGQAPRKHGNQQLAVAVGGRRHRLFGGDGLLIQHMVVQIGSEAGGRFRLRGIRAHMGAVGPVLVGEPDRPSAAGTGRDMVDVK